jgi:hypothetical protein
MAEKFFHDLFSGTEKDADEQQKKFETDRDADIDMYRKVLYDPSSSPEQRTKAADQISKLRNLKKGASPYQRLADFLNHVGKHVQSRGQQSQPQGEQPGGSATRPESLPPIDPQTQKVQEKTQGLGSKLLTKVSHGLGTGLGVAGEVLGGTNRTPSLPPIDLSVIPTGEQAETQKIANQKRESEAAFELKKQQNQMKVYRDQLHEANPRMTEDELDRAVEMKFGGMAKSQPGVKAWMTGPDGKLIPATIENGQLVPLPISEGYTPVLPSTLPTQSSSSSTYNADTGTTTSGRTTQKVVPGAPGARPRTLSPLGGGGTSTAKPGGRVAAMAKDWANNGVEPSAKDRPAVQRYMQENGMEPVQKPTMQERKLADDIKKVEPKVEELTKFLEDNNLTQEGAGGMFSPSAWWERGKVAKAWKEYQAGIPPKDKQLGKLIKYAAAIKIMGAAPWMSIGRGKYLYSEIVQHLPEPTDTPAQLYEKIQFYQTILEDAKGSLPPSLFGGGSSGATGNVIKWTRDAQGNPVPATQ